MIVSDVVLVVLCGTGPVREDVGAAVEVQETSFGREGLIVKKPFSARTWMNEVTMLRGNGSTDDDVMVRRPAS
jgi:hypothetical protein